MAFERVSEWKGCRQLTDDHLEGVRVLDLHAKVDVLEAICLAQRIATFFDGLGSCVVWVSNLRSRLQRADDEFGGRHFGEIDEADEQARYHNDKNRQEKRKHFDQRETVTNYLSSAGLP